MFSIGNVLWAWWPRIVVRFPAKEETFLSSKGSCLGIKPTRHCIHWVSGSLFPWLYRPCLEALSSLSYRAESKNKFQSLVRLHGINKGKFSFNFPLSNMASNLTKPTRNKNVIFEVWKGVIMKTIQP